MAAGTGVILGMQYSSERFFGGLRRRATVLGLAACAAACQPQQQRLERLEAAQQQQARELAGLKQVLAERDAEVAELEACVDDLEGAVYEPDSAAYDEGPRLRQL